MNNRRVFTARNIGMLIKNKSKKVTVVRKTTSVHAAQELKLSIPKALKASWKESRPEKVARARKLLKDPNYPSPKVLNSVARLLAKHLS